MRAGITIVPILSKELDIYPLDLFERCRTTDIGPAWALYTISRREKDLMRKLVEMELPFYGPVVPKRYKSPGGRLRTSYVPLFSNYVFLFGDDEARYRSMTTNCVSQYVTVPNPAELIRDLKQFHDLIGLDAALTPEARIEAGTRVRVKTGRFRGFEGTVLRRENELRLLVSVNFLQSGASLLLEDCEVESL